jgi:short-subunit dehydrogenase/thioester reductase-like protein
VHYLVTGATGFIGGRLVEKLLAERSGTIHCLVREGSLGKLELRMDDWGGEAEQRVVPVIGDLGERGLGLSDADIEQLREAGVDTVVHLAAVYDITADATSQQLANVEGTRHVVEVANALGARLHHVSSIAAGGLYPGVLREDTPLDDISEGLDDPYFATKHASEEIARTETTVPWRVYRPSIVVGDSGTGEIDKVDGPYYFFRLLKLLGDRLPNWLPLLAPEGGTMNLVPVDYVVDAMDHIIHLEDEQWDGRVFHLVDPHPHTAGQLLDLVSRATDGPRFPLRVDVGLFDVVPSSVRSLVGAVTPVAGTVRLLLDQVGIPLETLQFLDWPTSYTDDNTRAALAGTDIDCPPLESYIDRLYYYWLRELAGVRGGGGRKGAIAGRTVMVTGASDGIGREVAMQVAEAGGHVLLVSRTREKLETVQHEIERDGGMASVHPCDLSDDEDIVRMAKEVLAEHGHVDILVNNAGRSIRRSVKLSLDRFHDYERTMQLNYFGAVRLTLELLPAMMERGQGHILNISSIGVQTNQPRFSAYVASKAALDAFGRCISSELYEDDIAVTSVYLPLVRTKMIAPTKQYKYFPALTPEEAAGRIVDAMVDRPKHVATVLGTAGRLGYALAPKAMDAVMSRGFSLFPDSNAARGSGERDGEDAARAARQRAAAAAAASPGDGGRPTYDRLLYAWLLRGVHW